MLDQVIAAYNEAIYDTDRQRALAVVHQALARGVTPEEIVFDVVVPAIEQMMAAIAANLDTSLAQHYLAAQIASDVTEAMLPRFHAPPAIKGRMVIGTAKGDLHSLGKRIVSGCLKSMMIEVIDLGVNVPAERFVEEAVRRQAQVIGISAMMVHTARGAEGCLKVRQLLTEQGLSQRMRLVVGGAPYRFNPDMYRTVGADAWAADGITAGRVITRLIHEVTS